MNIAYFGTPDISAGLLNKLIEHHISIPLVVTQPDKPVGKRLAVTPSPVKEMARQYDIETFDKELTKVSEPLLLSKLKECNIDLCLLFAYGKIISDTLLSSISHGFWNVHPSLLPLYRGAAPTVFPLLLGDTSTGCTLIQMNSSLDEGDILSQTMLSIALHEIRGSLEEKLIHLASEQVSASLALLERNTLTRVAQNSSEATYTRKITKQDGYIDLQLLQEALGGSSTPSIHMPALLDWYYKTNAKEKQSDLTSASLIYHMYQALTPWPGIWTKVRIKDEDKRLKILSAQLIKDTLSIPMLQLEGKPPVDFRTFQSAYRIL